MKALKVLWGLLVDDGRLVIVLLIALVLAAILAHFGQGSEAAVVIWLGLLISLGYSIDHQLRLKLRK